MKTKHLLVLSVLILAICMIGSASAADASTIAHSVLNGGAMLAGIPIATPLARSIKEGLAEPETKEGKAIAAELERISEQVKSFCQSNASAIADAATLSKKAKEQADELLSKQGELGGRLQVLEQLAAAGKKAGDGGEDEDSLGAVLRKAADGADSPIMDFVNARNKGKQTNIPVSRKALVNSGTTGAALNYPGGQILGSPQMPLLRRLTVRDLLMAGRTSKSVVFYQRETGYTNNAAVVSEGSLKPKSELSFELVTEQVRTLAHLFDISLQMLDDVDYLESYIGTRGMYGLKLVEEAELLNGSGTGQHLEGIYTAATQYAQPAGAEVTNEQDLDKLRLALLQVELAEAYATGIVLHPTNWANIELLKDSENRYIFANPQGSATPRLWNRDVVATQAMTLGRFLVGDFAMHAQILDRQDANIAISFENKDNFERNMATIRVEERLALAIYRPEAFVKGTLESAS
jgi:HK97 family phage major capsid protein